MKNFEIKTTYGAGLERIVDTSSSRTLGTVWGSSSNVNRPVTMPYTNIQIGSVVKDYSGREFFKGDYELGQGIPINRKY